MKKANILAVTILLCVFSLTKGQNTYYFGYDDGGKSKTRYAPVAQIPVGIIIDETKIAEKSTDIDSSFQTQDELVKIYPNPTTQGINIDVANSDNQTIIIEVFSLNGIKIFSQKYTESLIWIDLSSAISGNYLIIVNVGDEKISRRIIKE